MAWKLSSKTVACSIACHAVLLLLFHKLTIPVFKPAPPAPKIDLYVYHQRPTPTPVDPAIPPVPTTPEPTPTPSEPRVSQSRPSSANAVSLPKPSKEEAAPDEIAPEVEVPLPPRAAVASADPPAETPEPEEELPAQWLRPPPVSDPPASSGSVFERPVEGADMSAVDKYSRRGQLRSQLQAQEAPVQYQQPALTTSVMHPAGTPIQGTEVQDAQQEIPVIEAECDDAVTEGAALLAGIMGGTLRCKKRSLEEFLQQRDAERGY